MLRIFLLFLPILLTGCSAPASDPESITIALDLAPTSLDPRIGTDATSERLFQLLFSSLVRKNEHSDIEPDLAASWDVPDPQTYIFHLRTDARFQDGRPLTSKDVLYTFRTMRDGSIKTPKAGTFLLVDSVEAPDTYTVVFRLKQPFAPFIGNLDSATGAIIPEGSPPDFGNRPVGSGPFRLVRYVQDGEVVLERNDMYYGEKPHVRRVTFKVIPEAIVRALELRKGSVDAALNVLTPDMVEVLRKDHDLHVMTALGTNYQYLAFNLQDPVFADKRIRQAIAYAIDRDKILKYLLRDQARPATGVIPPSNWAYEPDVKTYPYDPDKARQLLREAGQPNLSFTYRTSTDEVGRMIATVLQQQFREVGIHMDIRSNEFATFYADVQKGNFQAYSLRWIGGNNDPDMFNLIFNSKMTPPNGANRGRYSNPEVDRLIDRARRETDIGKRRKAYRQIQKIVAEDLPYVSLWYLDNVAVFNKRIQGVKLDPAGGYEFLTGILTNARLAMR